MTMSTRQYGNWLRPRSAGLLGLGTIGTAVLMGLGIIVVFELMLGAPTLALVTGVAGAGVLWLTAARDRHGLSAARRGTTAIAWRAAKSGRRHLYRSGPLGRTPYGKSQLPGLSSTISLSEWTDGYGRPFALLESPSTSSFTVVLGTQPEGAALVDAEQIDAWVARWGDWLGNLGNQPGLEAASVTIETAPDAGTELERELKENVREDAPAFARAVMRDIGENYPLGGAQIRAYVALTFKAIGVIGGRRRTAEEMGRFLAPQLAGLASSLSETGAGAVYPLSAQDLCAVVRVAYDPVIAPVMERARQAGQLPPELSWDTAGPMAHQATWTNYRHDSGLSVSWTMTKAPSSSITAGALTALLAPAGVIARKRVTLLYRPIDVARAAAAVHADVNAANFNMTASKNPMASQVLAASRAAKTAAEEAAGAGLLNFGAIVTATVTETQAKEARAAGEDGFAWVEAEAEAEVMRCAQHAKLLLRRAYGSQDVAFSAGLPLGHVLSKHLAVPDYVQEML
ncbi:MAG: hypothetical protein Q4E05_03430 [Pseudoclavibacter sp.]|nr:hypothetical protein [Pseudoclavibacter sp.]